MLSVLGGEGMYGVEWMLGYRTLEIIKVPIRVRAGADARYSGQDKAEPQTYLILTE